MKFKSWFLESYKDVDPGSEKDKFRKLNMTANLKFNKDVAPLDGIKGLTRGFHLNTIISRIMQVWINGFEYAPVDYENDSFQYRIGKDDKRANNNYKAAYDLFKREIGNAVHSLPFKQGLNVNTGDHQDVLALSKQAFQGEESDLIQSMNNAFNIFWKVFGKQYKNQILNFKNFFEIVRDEFMKMTETLPSMGEDDGEISSSPFVKELDREIQKYERLYRK